jgi:hypothetical protein
MNAYFSAAKRGDVDTIARKIADPSLDLNAQDAVRRNPPRRTTTTAVRSVRRTRP